MIQELYTWRSQGLESKNVTQYQPGRPIGKKKKKKASKLTCTATGGRTKTSVWEFEMIFTQYKKKMGGAMSLT